MAFLRTGNPYKTPLTVYMYIKITIFLFSPISRETSSVQQAEVRLTHWNFRKVSVH